MVKGFKKKKKSADLHKKSSEKSSLAGFAPISVAIDWKKKKKTARYLHTKNHLLTDEISRYFNEPKKFAMYLGVIYRIGFNRAYQIFSEIKQSKAKTPAKLFMWKVEQLKIKKKRRKNKKAPK